MLIKQFALVTIRTAFFVYVRTSYTTHTIYRIIRLGILT